MRFRTKCLGFAVMCAFGIATASAQFYTGAFVGFNTSGLKGALKYVQQGQSSVGNVADAGSTAFTFGLTGGYQVLPPGTAGGWYKLDIALEASYASYSYFENGFNSVNGAGKFAADGLSGGGTSIIAFDIMPIHRLVFPHFKLLSPYIGLGLGIDWLSTSDITSTNAAQSGTFSGTSQVKMGLLVFYGVVFHVSDMFQPYLQFKHMVPFGSESQFISSFQPTGGQAGGNQTFEGYIEDVPGHFSLTGGVRVEL